MSLILKQENANSIPVPTPGKGSLFLSATDDLSLLDSSGNVTTFAAAQGSNTGVYYDQAGTFGNDPTFAYDYANGILYVGNTSLSPSNAVVVSGNISANNANLTAMTVSGKVTLPGTSSVPALLLTNLTQITTVSATAATGTIAIYPATQSVLYYTSNATANWTVNLTFSSGTTMNTALATGQSLTVVFMATQGSSPYYNTAVQVDGTTSGVTTKWQDGAPSSGNANGIDIYTYTVIKTATSTFTVLASQVSFT